MLSGPASPFARHAAAPLARTRRYTPATFSFNVGGRGAGRCEVCEGAGHVQVEMVFLADVFVPCEACNATRYRREVLDVKLHGYSVADVLRPSPAERAPTRLTPRRASA